MGASGPKKVEFDVAEFWLWYEISLKSVGFRCALTQVVEVNLELINVR